MLLPALVPVLLAFLQDTVLEPSDRLRTIFFPHEAPVHAATIPHASTILLSLDSNGTLTGWDRRTSRRLYARPALPAADLPQRFVCSPDGRFVALTSRLFSSELVRVIAVDSGAEVRRFDRCFSPVFSPDGRILAGSDGTSIRRWSLQSGAELPGLPFAKEGLRWVAYAPDSRKIAASVRGTWELALWDLETRTLSYQERKSLGATEVTGLAFTADSKDLTVGTPWGVDLGEGMAFEEQLLGGPPLLYTPGGRLLIGGRRSKHLQIWEVEKKKCSFAEYLPFESSESLWASEDGDAVLRIDGRGIQIEPVLVPLKQGPPMPPVTCVGYDPEGNELVADSQGVITLWSSGRTKELKRFVLPFPGAVGFSRDGEKALLVASASSVVIWNLEAGREYRKVDSIDHLSACSLSPEGSRVLLGTVEGLIVLWDLESRKEIWRVSGEVWVSALAWSSDGKTIAWGDAIGGIGTVDSQKGGNAVRRRSRGNAITAIAVAPDGRAIVSGDNRGKILHWTDDVTREPSLLRTAGDSVAALAWSPDGRWIVGSGSYWVWMGATDGTKTDLVLRGSKGRTVSLAISPDGTAVLGGGTEPSVLLWRLPAKK